jgi:hypothetical protein
MRSSVLHAALVVTAMAGALAVGAACTGPDSPDDVITDFHATAAGNNLTAHTNLSDTAARANITLHWTTGTSYTYTYALGQAPAGTVKQIRILQGTVNKGSLCSAAPCGGSGSVTGVTDTALYRTLRNVGATIRIGTDIDSITTSTATATLGAQAGGAMAGAITPQ